jgi:four helix bundle protein
MPVQSYREEVVSGKAMDLVNAIYAATTAWPNEELHALANAIRRAAVSAP